MQSFIQYRNFRKQVEKQYHDHTEPAGQNVTAGHESGTAPDRPVSRLSSSSRPSSSSSSSSSLPRSRREDGSFHDIEKVECTVGDRDEGRLPEELDAHKSGLAEGDQHVHDDLESRPSRPNYGHLGRMETQATQQSQRTALGRALTGVNVRDRESNEGGTGKIFVVGYLSDSDPMDPHTWSYATRIGATMLIAAIGFVVGVASSIDSSALRQAAADFGVSEVAESLATGIYLIGFGVGALFAGPLSETLGRNP
jgi:hypothetical protein